MVLPVLKVVSSVRGIQRAKVIFSPNLAIFWKKADFIFRRALIFYPSIYMRGSKIVIMKNYNNKLMAAVFLDIWHPNRVGPSRMCAVDHTTRTLPLHRLYVERF